MAATMAAAPWLCLWVAWWEAQEEERRGWGEGVEAGMLVVAFEIGGGCLAVAGVEIQWAAAMAAHEKQAHGRKVAGPSQIC